MSEALLEDSNGVVSVVLENDFDVSYTHYTSRTDTTGKPKSVLLSKFLLNVNQPTRTHESVAEFNAMPDAEKVKLKDAGGFIGGLVKPGRTSSAVANRTFIALDIDDHVERDILSVIHTKLSNYAYTVYSTRKHTDAKPRYRVLVYLSEPVLSDEYQPIARKIAQRIGMENFDPTTFAVARLMFYPTTSMDGCFLYKHNDMPPIVPNTVLMAYDKEFKTEGAWRDAFNWPQCPQENSALMTEIDKQKKPAVSPLAKRNIIGAFCNIYTVKDAIDTFLTDVYKPHSENRYTYVSPQTQGVGGLILYEQGLFSYSQHSTDPSNTGHLCNAFDLVRIHLFGAMDSNISANTIQTKIPSYVAMIGWIKQSVPDVMLALNKMGLNPVADDMVFELFGDLLPEQLMADTDQEKADAKWLSELIRAANNTIIPNMKTNVVTILQNDVHLKSAIRYNEFNDVMETREGQEWRDKDDTAVAMYIERKYNFAPSKDAFHAGIDYYARKVTNYHPVKQYLEALVWDGVERCASLFVDWLGAEDNVFMCEAASLFTRAAVSRIYHPGRKFDHMVIIDGKQGLGKSTFFSLLGKGVWHGELSTLDDQKAAEAMSGLWIIEMPELKAKQGASDGVKKAFITKPAFKYRAAYARRAETRPVWYVLTGTTNEATYLTDTTGNRRYWPVSMHKALDIKGFTGIVDQIWAEAYQNYLVEPSKALVLSDEAVELANEAQSGKQDVHEWFGIIQHLLEMPAPADRYRRDFDPLFAGDSGQMELRTKICASEIAEALGLESNKLTVSQRNTIKECMVSMGEWGWIYPGTLQSYGRYGKQRGWSNPNNYSF